MDTIFAFIEPFVTFSTTYYIHGLFTFIVVGITSFIIYIHLLKISKRLNDLDGEDFLGFFLGTFFSSLFWPLLVGLATVIIVGYLYYKVIGMALHILFKRFAK